MSRLNSFLSLTMAMQATMVNKLLTGQSFAIRNEFVNRVWGLIFSRKWQYAVKINTNRENDAKECVSRNRSLFPD